MPSRLHLTGGSHVTVVEDAEHVTDVLVEAQGSLFQAFEASYPDPLVSPADDNLWVRVDSVLAVKPSGGVVGRVE